MRRFFQLLVIIACAAALTLGCEKKGTTPEGKRPPQQPPGTGTEKQPEPGKEKGAPPEQQPPEGKEMPKPEEPKEGAGKEQPEGTETETDRDANARAPAERLAEPLKVMGGKESKVERSDDDIQMEVSRKFNADSQLKQYGVKPTVKDGALTLAGSVPDDASKTKAEHLAQTVHGVTKIKNDIRVTGQPAQAPRMSDDQMKQELQSKIQADSQLRGSMVNVDISNGTATITGSVPDDKAKSKLDALAKTVAGVKNVKNDARVGREGEGAGAGAGAGRQGQQGEGTQSRVSPPTQQSKETQSGVKPPTQQDPNAQPGQEGKSDAEQQGQQTQRELEQSRESTQKRGEEMKREETPSTTPPGEQKGDQYNQPSAGESPEDRERGDMEGNRGKQQERMEQNPPPQQDNDNEKDSSLLPDTPRDVKVMGGGKEKVERGDEDLRTEIRAKMDADNRLKPYGVKATVDQGKVTLSGNVPQNEDKRKAEDLVNTIAGVKDVENNITVTGEKSRVPQLSDQDMARELQAKIAADSQLKGQAVNVEVKNGQATITGIVGTDESKKKAAKLAKTVSGITDVDNKLQVKSEDEKSKESGAGAAPGTGGSREPSPQSSLDTPAADVKVADDMDDDEAQAKPQDQPRREQPPTQPKEDQARMQRSDNDLREEFEEKVDADRVLNEYKVKGKVEGGTLTITGSVPQDAQKKTAERLARTITGIKDVKNDLQVTGEQPEVPKMTDEQMRDELQEKIEADKTLKSENITVNVTAADAMITGTVANQEMKTKVGELAKTVAGLKAVRNDLQVTGQRAQGEGTEKRSDTSMSSEVRAKLLADSQLNDYNIGVTVTNAKRTLTGTVPSNELKQKADSLAKTIAGISDVNNQLEATGEATPPVGKRSDSAMGAEMKAKLFADSQLSGWGINVDTSNNVITLRGKVESDALKKKATTLAKTIAGVTDVRNDLRVQPSEKTVDEKSDLSDIILARKIQNDFQNRAAMKGSNIQIDVAKGVVTLNGTVQTTTQKRMAQDIAISKSGVREVKNNLEIKPESLEPQHGEQPKAQPESDAGRKGAEATVPDRKGAEGAD